MQPESFLLLISSTLFLCYISGLFYTRTKIPDIIWLLGFGVLMGPVLGFFERRDFVYVSNLMGTIALNIITFNSGIGLDIRIFTKTLLKSTALTLATFLAVIPTVGYSVSIMMPETFTLMEGLILGTMLAGISTVAVTTLLDGLGKLIPNLESTRALLILESTICDPLRVVTIIAIMRIIMLSGVPIRDSFRDVVFNFVMASIIGLAIGLVWAEVLDRLRGQINYMMTIAALFPTYLIAEMVAGNGGGTMAAFIFGLVLSNYRYFAKKLDLDRSIRLNLKRIVDLNEEITFLLKSYYFLYIGLIVTLSPKFLIAGVGIVAILISVRFVIASGVSRIMGFTKEEKVVSRLVFTLGTSTLVLSQLPSIYDPSKLFILNQDIFPEICFPVVLGTVIFGALVSPKIARRQLRI